MAMKILDCARVLPGTGCRLILIGEPDEVLTAYDLHSRERHHDVTEIEPGREPANQLQNVVFSMPNRAYIGDDFERVGGDTIRIPGPGVVMQRFGEDTTTLRCRCGDGTGSCSLTVSGHFADCTADSCTNCAFDTIVTGSIADMTLLPEFLTE